MATLQTHDEVELAKLLLAIHPWAKQARFMRSGGEAMTVAVRIARASTGRDKIAVCGYHGWHDWYLAANLATPEGNSSKDANFVGRLDKHLLPGLDPKGVPSVLAGTTLPFHYNKLDELDAGRIWRRSSWRRRGMPIPSRGSWKACASGATESALGSCLTKSRSAGGSAWAERI